MQLLECQDKDIHELREGLEEKRAEVDRPPIQSMEKAMMTVVNICRLVANE